MQKIQQNKVKYDVGMEKQCKSVRLQGRKKNSTEVIKKSLLEE